MRIVECASCIWTLERLWWRDTARMMQGLEASHSETTCCVCAAADVPHKDRRKVSEALALIILDRKLNEISQISLKLPDNAIIIVCKHCSDQVAKVERLETEMAATRSRTVQLIDQHAQHWQRRKRTLSPSFRGTGITPASKKVTLYLINGGNF